MGTTGQSCTSLNANSCNLSGVRVYEVRAGDSPAGIASRDDMAGCPRCAIDLVRANSHKETVTHPNGFVSFKELRAGEKLNLPEKWFDGTLDRLPKSYFSALPHADGVTPGKGMLSGPFPDNLVAAAQAADAALAAVNDAYLDYCLIIPQVGTPVNSAVHAFKLAWNATQSPKVPINTGNYEEPTAEALRLVLGEAFEPCATRAAPTYTARPKPPAPQPVRVTPQNEFSTGAIVGTALVGASAVAAAIYLTTKPRPRRR